MRSTVFGSQHPLACVIVLVGVCIGIALDPANRIPAYLVQRASSRKSCFAVTLSTSTVVKTAQIICTFLRNAVGIYSVAVC